MTIGIGKSNSNFETSTGFGRLRLLHQMTPTAVAPMKVAAPISFAGAVPDRFQKGVHTVAKAMSPKLGAPLTFAAMQQHKLEGHPDFIGRQAPMETKANPFKLAAAGDPSHPIFAGQKNPALPTINYFSSKNIHRNIKPPVESSSPSLAAIPAIAGIGMLFTQVLAPAITILKSVPVLSAVSQINPLPAIKTYLQVLIPHV